MTEITREQVIEAMAKAARDRNEVGPYKAESQWLDYCEAALTAIEALGFKIVPYEPTEEMIYATYASSGHRHIDNDEKRDIYKWMLSASPLYKEPSNDAGADA